MGNNQEIQEKCDKAKAIGDYKKFFDFCKDADPGIVEVKDTKKRLTKLKKECF